MEPCKEEKTPSVRAERKPRRFRIDRLEERIAPGKCGPGMGGGPWTPIYKNGDHGPIIGWSSPSGSFFC
jgi:hypothetical protein